MALFFSNTSYSSFHLPIFWVFIWLISQKVPSNQEWKLSSLEFTCLNKCLLEYSSMKTSSLNKFFLFPWKKKRMRILLVSYSLLSLLLLSIHWLFFSQYQKEDQTCMSVPCPIMIRFYWSEAAKSETGEDWKAVLYVVSF